MKRVAICQSTYIPWKGFFDNVGMVDTFVFYDDMQYSKGSWSNRNRIKTPRGSQWLSIPVEVSGKLYQKIKDVKVVDRSWADTHWRILKENYRKAPFFNETAAWLEPLYRDCNSEYLSEINYHFFSAIKSNLKINTEIRFSTEFNLDDERNQRLVNICSTLKATDYYTGPAAKDYLDESKFKGAGISVHYYDYSGYNEYPQLHPPFDHAVSILDLVFNVGNKATSFMKVQP